MLKHDVSIIMGVREGRMAFHENIEENMTRIFNQLCEEDLCRVSLYYETIHRMQIWRIARPARV